MVDDGKGEEPMTGSMEPLKRRVGFRWDGVVTLGNVLTMLGMLASLLMIGIMTIMWFVRLEGRIDRTIERQAWFEAETRRDQARNAQALSELKEAIKNENGKTQAAVDRVLTYLLERNRGVQ